jgi:hypothetical protein
MRTLFKSVKTNAAAYLVSGLISLGAIGINIALSVRDLEAESARQEARIAHVEGENRDLADEVVNLRIASERLTVATEQLLREIQHLRADITR